MAEPALRPIASKLIRSIFGWATVCSVLFIAAQSLYLYQHVKGEFEDELQQIALTNVPLLAINLWDIEPDAVREQIRTMAARPHIGYVGLTALTGQKFSGGEPRLLERCNIKHFEIRPPTGGIGSLGRLEICANPSAFYRELLITVGITAAGYLALTLLICGLCVVVLRHELALPLRQVAEYVTALTPQSLSTPLTLARPAGHARDEIDLVVDGFRVLQAEINGHIHNLDQLVVQRTHDLQSALGSIQRLSLIDPLTQCLNRRAFDTQIEQEIERAQRYGRPLSLAFGDIDHFKRINDTEGHLVGDQVLRAAAQCLRDGLRTDIDWIARFGGEEFVILMPETDLAGGLASAERLRSALSEATLLPDMPAFRVTISFGVVEYVAGEPVQGMLLRADKLLYQAKHSGRNQTWPLAAGGAAPDVAA